MRLNFIRSGPGPGPGAGWHIALGHHQVLEIQRQEVSSGLEAEESRCLSTSLRVWAQSCCLGPVCSGDPSVASHSEVLGCVCFVFVRGTAASGAQSSSADPWWCHHRIQQFDMKPHPRSCSLRSQRKIPELDWFQVDWLCFDVSHLLTTCLLMMSPWWCHRSIWLTGQLMSCPAPALTCAQRQLLPWEPEQGEWPLSLQINMVAEFLSGALWEQWLWKMKWESARWLQSPHLLNSRNHHNPRRWSPCCPCWWGVALQWSWWVERWVGHWRRRREWRRKAESWGQKQSQRTG